MNVQVIDLRETVLDMLHQLERDFDGGAVLDLQSRDRADTFYLRHRDTTPSRSG